MIIPSSIKTFDSIGEKILYNKFKSDNSFKNLIIIHSQFLAKHISSISGEIDFLLIYPNHGVFVLELKHGRVERQDGVWKFYNRKGQESTSTKGPFRQASDAMHSIRNWLLDNCHTQYKEKLGKTLFGTGVIFSGFDEMLDIGTEGFQWQVLYRDLIVKNQILHYFENLSKGWHSERSNQRWYNQTQSRPTFDLCLYISKLLRGDFLRDYSLLNKIRDNNTIIQEFTDSQLEKYSHILYNDRNLVIGPAGTGINNFSLSISHRNH